MDANQYGDQVEVRAFANSIEDGTCSYTFTMGDNSFTKSTPAYADASTTPCINLEVSVADFSSSGTWNLFIQYESASFKGIAETSIEVTL